MHNSLRLPLLGRLGNGDRLQGHERSACRARSSDEGKLSQRTKAVQRAS